MADGSPSYMTRNLGSGTWTYSRALQPNQSNPQQTSTTVLDPDSNETDLNFSGVYEAYRKAFKGNSSGSLLDYQTICINNPPNLTACENAVVTSSISRRTVYDHLNGSNINNCTWAYDYLYNSYGLLTQEVDYDFTGGLVVARATTINYNTALNTYNIYDRPASVQIANNNWTNVAVANYSYDQGGNTHGSVTEVDEWTSGSTYLKQSYTYNSNGTVATATDPNSTQTAYSYAGNSCNNAFPTSVTVAGMTYNYSYDCRGGVVNQLGPDPNNH